MFVITSNYGFRKRPNTNKTEFTSGTDIVPQTKDKSVQALAPGKIVNIAVDKYAQAGMLDPSKHKGLGHYMDVEISSGPYAGHIVRYGHLDPIKNKDQLLGKSINIGDKIGGFGVGSGSGTGPHVKVYLINSEGKKVDPTNLLSDAKKSLENGTGNNQNLTNTTEMAESFSNIDPNQSTQRLAEAQKQQEQNNQINQNPTLPKAETSQYQSPDLSLLWNTNQTGTYNPQLDTSRMYQSQSPYWQPQNRNDPRMQLYNQNAQLELQKLNLQRQKQLYDRQIQEKNNALDNQYAQKQEAYQASTLGLPSQPFSLEPKFQISPTKYMTDVSDMSDELSKNLNENLASAQAQSRQTANDYYGLNLGSYYQYG